MTKAERQLVKNRKAAEKLSNPTPIELPSHAWRCQVTLNGKRVGFVADTPEDAHAQALAAKAGLIEAKKQEKTHLSLEDAVQKYMDEAEGILSPSTIRGYDIIKRARFQDIINENIYTLADDQIKQSVRRELAAHSVKTVKNSVGLLHAVLKRFGVSMPEISLPQATKPNKRYLQPNDVGKLIDAVKGDRCEIPILIAVWMGLRRSEILGLCWDCVDMENNLLIVRRAVVQDKDNKLVMKDYAKNISSQRTVDCPDYIMDKIKAQYTPGATGKLFDMHPETLRRHIHKACEKAGIPDTSVHGLRHTNAAVMKTIGVSDSIAMERGGWTNLKTYQNTYSYIFDKEEKKANRKINNFFENCTRNRTRKK